MGERILKGEKISSTKWNRVRPLSNWGGVHIILKLYYSTLAKLMMKQDLDLSADDDDVHSWLDALNERELSR